MKIKEMELIKKALEFYMDNGDYSEGEEWEIEELWNDFNDKIEISRKEENFINDISEEEILKMLGI